jgi:hypothetical protein
MRDFRRLGLGLISAVVLPLSVPHLVAQTASVISNENGLRLLVAEENTQPTVRIVLPGKPLSDQTIEVLFPEHVTVRKHGETDAEHLYLFRGGKAGEPVVWRRVGQSLQYEKDLKGDIHLTAIATLEGDGVLFRYEFTNGSKVDYDMVWAPLDPRLTSIFHDVRLERTYVHLKEGFQLLASETPDRVTMPLDKWLPARYKASFTWPVPPQLVEHGKDGITYYYKSKPVDEPMVATLSEDHKWVVASFSHTAGNVWSNPELTCQHVDEEKPMAPGQKAVLEVKLLVFAGSLDEAFEKVVQQRNSVK